MKKPKPAPKTIDARDADWLAESLVIYVQKDNVYTPTDQENVSKIKAWFGERSAAIVRRRLDLGRKKGKG